MNSIDVYCDLTEETPCFWDGYWDNEMGASKYDPDVDCKVLQKYHKIIWSKKLPCGEFLDLIIGKGADYLTWKGFRFGSDSITVSFRYEKFKSMILKVREHLKDYKSFVENYVRKSYTVGGTIIFPKYKGGINQSRGLNPAIRDRFDLTLECIRRYYNGEDSPLLHVLMQNKNFFDLFVDFKGYVDFFFLQDLVSPDYKSVEYWIGCGIGDNPFPETVEEYFNLIEKELDFVQKRNNRIELYVRNFK